MDNFSDYSDADESIPGYDDFSDHLSPEDFIRTFWKDASDEMRGHMITYMFKHPFEGCFTYISEWVEYVKRTHGVINPI